MIIIKNIIKHGKTIIVFTLFEFFISFLISLINLMGVSDSLTSLLSLIINFIMIFILSFKNGKKAQIKGIYEGLLLSGIFIFIMLFINLIFIKIITLKSCFYFLGVILITTSSCIMGKNKTSTLNKK